MNPERKIFFEKVAILGVGLIGASCALALRERKLCASIIGYGRTQANLEKAKEKGIIDRYTLDLKDAVRDAHLIILATPPGFFKPIIEEVKGLLKKGALVTDVGSVKSSVIADLEPLMPDGVFFVGSHPIAGSDKSGIHDARPDLFQNALCIITPTEKTDENALATITALWESLGARVEQMDARAHDEVYAAVSHLPHLIAYALVNTIEKADAAHINYAGQGFKDTTRIAQSSPELWADISLMNREALLRLLPLFKNNLEKLEKLLQEANRSALEQELGKAQKLRMKLQ